MAAQQLTTFILTAIIAANQYARYPNPISPVEYQLMATDSSMTEFFLVFPELEILNLYNPDNGEPGLGEYLQEPMGIDVKEVIDWLEEEHDLCVVVPRFNGSFDDMKAQQNSTDITFTRSNGITDAPGHATAVNYAYPNPFPELFYIRFYRDMGGLDPEGKWLPYYSEKTMSVNPFEIGLNVKPCAA